MYDHDRDFLRRASDRCRARLPRRAFLAGLLATIAITISMALFGQNIMKMLGSMVLGSGSSAVAQYLVGSLIHLMIGLFYGFAYAWLMGPVRAWGRPLKAAVFGIAITSIALVSMPVMSAMMGGGAANPCGSGKGGMAANPCNPCTPCNPCNPCGPTGSGEKTNPCNPCGPQAKASQPCNPPGGGSTAGNACGGSPDGGGSPYGPLVSLVNHLIYAFVLAFVYER